MDHRLKPKDIYKNSMYKIFQVLFFILVCSYIHFSDNEFSITIVIIQFILIVVSSIYLCEIFFIIASTYIFRNHDTKYSPTNIEYYNGSYIFIKVNNKADQYLILKGESFINLIGKDEK